MALPRIHAPIFGPGSEEKSMVAVSSRSTLESKQPLLLDSRQMMRLEREEIE